MMMMLIIIKVALLLLAGIVATADTMSSSSSTTTTATGARSSTATEEEEEEYYYYHNNYIITPAIDDENSNYYKNDDYYNNTTTTTNNSALRPPTPHPPNCDKQPIDCWLWNLQLPIPDQSFHSHFITMSTMDISCTNFVVQSISSEYRPSSQNNNNHSHVNSSYPLLQLSVDHISARCAGKYHVSPLGLSGNVEITITGGGGANANDDDGNMDSINIEWQILSRYQNNNGNNHNNNSSDNNDNMQQPIISSFIRYPVGINSSMCHSYIMISSIYFSGSISAHILDWFQNTISNYITNTIQKNLCSIIIKQFIDPYITKWIQYMDEQIMKYISLLPQKQQQHLQPPETTHFYYNKKWHNGVNDDNDNDYYYYYVNDNNDKSKERIIINSSSLMNKNSKLYHQHHHQEQQQQQGSTYHHLQQQEQFQQQQQQKRKILARRRQQYYKNSNSLSSSSSMLASSLSRRKLQQKQEVIPQLLDFDTDVPMIVGIFKLLNSILKNHMHKGFIVQWLDNFLGNNNSSSSSILDYDCNNDNNIDCGGFFRGVTGLIKSVLLKNNNNNNNDNDQSQQSWEMPIPNIFHNLTWKIVIPKSSLPPLRLYNNNDNDNDNGSTTTNTTTLILHIDLKRVVISGLDELDKLTILEPSIQKFTTTKTATSPITSSSSSSSSSEKHYHYHREKTIKTTTLGGKARKTGTTTTTTTFKSAISSFRGLNFTIDLDLNLSTTVSTKKEAMTLFSSSSSLLSGDNDDDDYNNPDYIIQNKKKIIQNKTRRSSSKVIKNNNNSGKKSIRIKLNISGLDMNSNIKLDIDRKQFQTISFGNVLDITMMMMKHHKNNDTTTSNDDSSSSYYYDCITSSILSMNVIDLMNDMKVDHLYINSTSSNSSSFSSVVVTTNKKTNNNKDQKIINNEGSSRRRRRIIVSSHQQNQQQHHHYQDQVVVVEQQEKEQQQQHPNNDDNNNKNNDHDLDVDNVINNMLTLILTEYDVMINQFIIGFTYGPIRQSMNDWIYNHIVHKEKQQQQQQQQNKNNNNNNDGSVSSFIITSNTNTTGTGYSSSSSCSDNDGTITPQWINFTQIQLLHSMNQFFNQTQTLESINQFINCTINYATNLVFPPTNNNNNNNNKSITIIDNNNNNINYQKKNYEQQLHSPFKHQNMDGNKIVMMGGGGGINVREFRMEHFGSINHIQLLSPVRGNSEQLYNDLRWGSATNTADKSNRNNTVGDGDDSISPTVHAYVTFDFPHMNISGDLNITALIGDFNTAWSWFIHYDMNKLRNIPLIQVLAHGSCIAVPSAEFLLSNIRGSIGSFVLQLNGSITSPIVSVGNDGKGDSGVSTLHTTDIDVTIDKSSRIFALFSNIMSLDGTILKGLTKVVAENLHTRSHQLCAGKSYSPNGSESEYNYIDDDDNGTTEEAVNSPTFFFMCAAFFLAQPIILVLAGYYKQDDENIIDAFRENEEHSTSSNHSAEPLVEPLEQLHMDGTTNTNSSGKAKASSSLVSNVSLSAQIRHFIPALILIAIVFFLFSNTTTVASLELSTSRNDISTPQSFSMFEFSVASMARILLQAQTYFLLVVILTMSGMWPYLKLVLTLCFWTSADTNNYALSYQKREQYLVALDALGKFTVTVMYVAVLLITVLRYRIDFSSRRQANMDNDDFLSYSVNAFVQPWAGFYFFLVAICLSFIVGHISTYLHRRTIVSSLQTNREGATTTATTMANRKNNNRFEPLESVFDHWFHLNDRDGYRQLSRQFQFLLLSCLLLTGAMLGFGMTESYIRFEVGGITGILLGDHQRRTEYSVISLGTSMLATSNIAHPMQYSVGIVCVQVLYFLCTVITPYACLLLLLLLLICPMTTKSQHICLTLAEIANSWSALEAFVLTMIATSMEISTLASAIVADKCYFMNEILHDFDEKFVSSSLSLCFTIDASLMFSKFWLVLFPGVLLYSLVVSQTLRFVRCAIHERLLLANDSFFSSSNTEEDSSSHYHRAISILDDTILVRLLDFCGLIDCVFDGSIPVIASTVSSIESPLNHASSAFGGGENDLFIINTRFG